MEIKNRVELSGEEANAFLFKVKYGDPVAEEKKTAFLDRIARDLETEERSDGSVVIRGKDLNMDGIREAWEEEQKLLAMQTGERSIETSKRTYTHTVAVADDYCANNETPYEELLWCSAVRYHELDIEEYPLSA